MLFWSIALADGGNDDPDPLRWVTEWGGIRIDGHAGAAVSFEVRSRFSNTEITWSLEPIVNEGQIVELTIPPQAFRSELQRLYVTDLVVYATIDGVSYVSSNAYLAWPVGTEGPVLWDRAAMEYFAPQGVLDPSLRVDGPPSERATRIRVYPPATDGIRPDKFESTEVEP